ncbi:hypothetical protein HHI36_009544 [Cryptolaemus montrouzieri]|uniref:Uncharacterized protein n=1 Tax=Cryptolaemus montrouzieri TaxID=559131 RepID=A0ABD2MG17_9CUCU
MAFFFRLTEEFDLTRGSQRSETKATGPPRREQLRPFLLNRPLTPAAQLDQNYIEYCDPFDTSIVETVKQPGQTELKFLEKELLSDIHDLSDDDFNPRAEEAPRERSVSRPDALNFSGSKSVCFDATTLKEKDYIEVSSNALKLSKPPTPFYIRKNSVPGTLEDDFSPEPLNSDNLSSENNVFSNTVQEAVLTSAHQPFNSELTDQFCDLENDLDPFDTSIANSIVGTF